MTFPRGMELEGAAVKRPEATVYQKHRSLRSRKTTYKGDACPVPEGHEERLAFGRSLESKPRVNGGGNYNRPKVAGPRPVSSDLHEWRNDLGAVSTRDPVKL